jgi:hypothetical protein
MTGNTKTNAPATTAAGLPSRRQRAEWFPCTAEKELNLAVEQDPERARAFGNAIQAASRRTGSDNLAAAAAIAEDRAVRANLRAGREYVRGLNQAGALLRQAAAIKADDTVGEFAGYLADQIEREVAKASSTLAPDAAPSLPEVPGNRKEATP